MVCEFWVDFKKDISRLHMSRINDLSTIFQTDKGGGERIFSNSKCLLRFFSYIIIGKKSVKIDALLENIS